MKASEEGHTEIVELLLAHRGIDVNIRDQVREWFFTWCTAHRSWFLQCRYLANVSNLMFFALLIPIVSLRGADERRFKWSHGDC